MKKLNAVLLLIAATAIGPGARAEDTGFTLGTRAAFGIPFGVAGNKADFNKLASAAVPFQLDLGYRFDGNWSAGAYFGYGFALIADEAKSGLQASGATDVGGHAIMRVGLQGIYTILPDARFAPWVGLGLGYEWTRYASATPSGATSGTELGFRGFEASVQVGGDYALGHNVAIGPFASLSFGRFDHAIAGRNDSVDVADKSIHEWLQLGVRASFRF
jgi:outer membrane protein W